MGLGQASSCASRRPRVIYDSTCAFDGSISAEHGLGQSKRGIIADYKDSHELDLMRGLKQLFDPRGLMNPGKLLPGSRAGYARDLNRDAKRRCGRRRRSAGGCSAGTPRPGQDHVGCGPRGPR
ncbi:FAD-binding oxidoreductase [Micromonospora sp. RTP1Z1]|uniref:FAD-binding oxidoreductase n=1 Tax=Micromonospora sp. RTP1Z1 TaxID=2994043 RepID=UPI0039B479DD